LYNKIDVAFTGREIR